MGCVTEEGMDVIQINRHNCATDDLPTVGLESATEIQAGVLRKRVFMGSCVARDMREWGQKCINDGVLIIPLSFGAPSRVEAPKLPIL